MRNRKDLARAVKAGVERDRDWGRELFPDRGPLPARPPVAPAGAAEAMGVIADEVAGCTACSLCETRSLTVPGEGPPGARVMFIGEAPGRDEDKQGRPFVGRAGRLLTDIIEKGMGLRREDVFIANILKCRPPGNRDPKPDEVRSCTPFLDRQIEAVAPEVLIPLGRHASCHLLETDLAMGKMRGRLFERNGVCVIPTYHPAYLLRNPAAKKDCWEDIQVAMGRLGLAPASG